MQVRFPEDERFPAWKITFLEYLVAAVFIALLFGYWRLQIGQHKGLLEEAEHNSVRDLPVIAPRGEILDRNGRVLVENIPSFTILLDRENASHLNKAHIDKIAKALSLEPSDIRKLIKRSARLPLYEPVVLKQTASLRDVAFIEAHQSDFPELDIIQSQQRYYPKHGVAAAVLGYVGQVSQSEIGEPGSHYRPGDMVGKFGTEKEYNSVLRGRDGMRRVVVNSRGQEVGTLGTVPAVPGHNLRLTLDLNLQLAAEAALGNRPGAVVALDPRTGGVLAMVSHPTFDPNVFTHPVSVKEWKELTTNPMHPLMNKAIQAQLAPGSMFKIITGAAALQSGTITPQFTIDCKGYVVIYGHTFHDWAAHGITDFHKAIVVSCDDYFYTLGKLLGIQKIDYYAKHLGLGHKTGIDLPDEEPGLIPSPAWVHRAFHRPWYPGETISVAIGQGAVQVTPLQIAYAIGGIVSGGVFHRPHLVFRKELKSLKLDPPAHSTYRFPLGKSTVQALTSGMWGVVNQAGGTGWGARVPGVEIAGKTGTAQVVNQSHEDASHRKRYLPNDWFVGYSPKQNPDIVVCVLTMHSRGYFAATPVAGDVFKAYYQEKSRDGTSHELMSQKKGKTKVAAVASMQRE